MAFFDDLSKKLSQATQTTVQKAQEMAEVAKLNSMVNDEEKRIESAYSQIGKTYCERLRVLQQQVRRLLS